MGKYNVWLMLLPMTVLVVVCGAEPAAPERTFATVDASTLDAPEEVATVQPVEERAAETTKALANPEAKECGEAPSLESAAPSEALAGTLATIEGMSSGRAYHSATLLGVNKVLVAGGEGTGSAQVFDTETGTWTEASSMATGRQRHTALLLKDPQQPVSSRVFVLGGEDPSGNPLRSAEIFDLRTGEWTSAGEMADDRSGPNATLMPPLGQSGRAFYPKGRVLVTGGTDSAGRLLSTSEFFNPAIDKWTPAGEMNEARANHTSILLGQVASGHYLGGRVLVTGGGNAGGPYVDSAELYDRASDTWSLSCPMLNARAFHTATMLHNGRVLVVGGLGAETSAEMYDPVSETWSRAGQTSEDRVEHSATLLGDGKVLVVGGIGSSPAVEIYDPETNSWAVVGQIDGARSGVAAALLPAGDVLLTGGMAEGSASAIAELYSP